MKGGTKPCERDFINFPLIRIKGFLSQEFYEKNYAKN